MKKINRECSDGWEFFFGSEKPPYQITGKYMFFSPDRELLVRIALDELESGAFHEAKVPMEGYDLGGEYVLCLYYADDSRKHELAEKYGDWANLKYRYWKTDEATLDGRYSEEFLRGLAPEARKYFTKKKLK
jgi:hypothetical protein